MVDVTLHSLYSFSNWEEYVYLIYACANGGLHRHGQLFINSLQADQGEIMSWKNLRLSNNSAASRERDYCLRVHRGAPSKVGDCSHPPPMAHHGFIILIYRVDRIYTFLSQFHFAEQRKMKRGEKRAMINQWCFVTMVTADEKWCWNMDVSVPAGLVLEMPWRRQIYLVYHRFLPQTHRDEVCLWPPSPMAPLRYSILEKKKRKKTRHHGDVTGASWRLN